jgi:ABC-type sugar transport system substrate-binding protein
MRTRATRLVAAAALAAAIAWPATAHGGSSAEQQGYRINLTQGQEAEVWFPAQWRVRVLVTQAEGGAEARGKLIAIYGGKRRAEITGVQGVESLGRRS